MKPDNVESTWSDRLPAGTPSELSETLDDTEQQPQTMRVYLRVRPFSKEELQDNEDQGCVVIESSQMVTLNAPKGSATMKSSEKGVGVSLHKFSFSQIFGPETRQADLFEGTVRSQVSEYLDGQNALIFSYGVTNAGKTFTIQGSAKEPGILPRVLHATFRHISGRQYEAMDLKPHLRNDAQLLAPDQVRQERSSKAAIFSSIKDENESGRGLLASELSSLSAPRLSFASLSRDQTALALEGSPEDGGHFALWVAFFEIYNECVYDLLQPSLLTKSKKRGALRVCDDGAGNAYVRDLKWVNIQTMEEACRLLRFGNKNRSAASTKMNQSSSRSHSIFTMKLLKINGSSVQRISEFSLCDLAGSERCNKTKAIGERLKEAGNINNSLLILGKCIGALRSNQSDRRTGYVPFRESKLTKLFQAVFCGKGRASMIVNINQCASTYDETLHVMKFSAVAKQIVVQVIPEKSLESLSLFGRDGRRLRMDCRDMESFLSEDELLDEDEGDVSLLPQNELVTMIESLKAKLLAERRKNLVQEMEIRKEMGDAMLQQLMEDEELRSRQMEELKEGYEEKLENTFEMYKDAIKEHAYQCALSRLEDDYVPLDEFLAEQEHLEVLRRKLAEMEMLVAAARCETRDGSCQTEPPKETDTAGEARWKLLYKEKCAVEKICEDKQLLILSLERRLAESSVSLQKVRECLLAKAAEVKVLQEKVDDQSKSLDEALMLNVDKDEEIIALKADITRLSQRSSPPLAKSKRGLLANIRDSVTSPHKRAIGRTLRKTAKVVRN